MRDFFATLRGRTLPKLGLLLASCLAPAAALAGDVVWNLNSDGRYAVQVHENGGKIEVLVKNSRGTWRTTNPNFIRALTKGLQVVVDGKTIVPKFVAGQPPRGGTFEKPHSFQVFLYGHELAHYSSQTKTFGNEKPLSAFDIRKFATDTTYPKSFHPVPDPVSHSSVRLDTDLHTHLAGHLSFDSLVDIAYQHDLEYPVALLDRIGVRYPKSATAEGKIRFRALVDSPEFKGSQSMARLEDALTIETSHVRTFLDMESRYMFRGPITKNVGAFRDMLWAVARSFAKSGVTYTEQSISNVLDPEWLKVAQEELPKIEKSTGVKIRFVVGLWRHSDPEWNLDEIIRTKRMARATPYVVGIDFMGHETNSSSDLGPQLKAAAELKKEFGPEFQVRVHAGENPLNPSNVRVAAELGATRIGHGLYIEKNPAELKADPHTQAISPKVFEALHQAGAYIELNPTSNQALNNLSGGDDVLFRQFRQFKAAGVPVVIGSDGIGMYGADHREIQRMLVQLGFTDDDFKYIESSEKKYLARAESSFRARSASIAASGTGIPTRQELAEFVKSEGQHYTPEFEAKQAKVREERIQAYVADMAHKGITNYEGHEADFQGMKAIDVSGGSMSQFATLEKEGRLGELKVEEIRKNFQDLLARIDPKKVFFLTGGTQFGVEKMLHEEVQKYNHLHPDSKFRIVGVMPEVTFPPDFDTKDVFGPEQGGITHYLRRGKGWSDIARYKLEVLLEHGGAKVAIAGKMFVADEFRSVINADLPIGVFYHDGPVGASSDLAKEQPSGAYKTMDDLLPKLVGKHPEEYLRPGAMLKLRHPAAAEETPQTFLKRTLTTVFEKYPAMRVIADPDHVKLAVTHAFDAATADRVVGLMKDQKPLFLQARVDALQGARPPPRLRTAVVSGLSAGGMVATALLAKGGYQVDAYELREDYTRNIQWAGRQALIDQLAAIDPKLADRFLKEVASPISKGSIHISDMTGERKVWDAPAPDAGDPTRIPRTGEEMLASASSVILECKVFERVLMDYVKRMPNVQIHRGEKISLMRADADGMYGVVGHGKPDVIVISEGAGSQYTRDLLGIHSEPASPPQTQIAGEVHQTMGGSMSKHLRSMEYGQSHHALLTGAMAVGGGDKTWIVAQVPDGMFFGSPPNQELVNAEFRKAAAGAMELPLEEINRLQIAGPKEGTQPTLFTLQQRISTKATAGKNVIGVGDFNGNAHWSVGGGMQVAVISHGERLKQLMLDTDLGVDRDASVAAYNQGALEDTLAWGRRGIADFYPGMDREEASNLFLESHRLWKEGKVPTMEAALNRFVSRPGAVSPNRPRDIILDLDGTLGYKIHGALGGPGDPLAGHGKLVHIVYDKPEINPDGSPRLHPDGTRVTTRLEENYRIYDGVPEAIGAWSSRPGVRVSFFSGGSIVRTRAILDQIRLPDGRTATSAAYRIKGENDLTRVANQGRYREMFRKDGRTVNHDVGNVLMVDDVDFTANDQKDTWFRINDEFPYPERGAKVPVTPQLVAREAARFRQAADSINRALDYSFRHEVPLTQAAKAIRGMECLADVLSQRWQ